MSDLWDLLTRKRAGVLLSRDDLVEELDSPGWKNRHPTGPVHVDIKCKICGVILASDLKEYGWLHNESFWIKHIAPHFSEKHTSVHRSSGDINTDFRIFVLGRILPRVSSQYVGNSRIKTRCGVTLEWKTQSEISMSKKIFKHEFDSPLDKGIQKAVHVLVEAGVETFESCQGGRGHAYTEPTVRFHGGKSEGFRALAAALQAGLKVAGLRRVWPVLDDEPTGPWWELTFVPTGTSPNKSTRR